MPWDTGLLEEQRVAASHIGQPARLLAGPGTGKTLTLTRRIVFLVEEAGVAPDRILALTFTRAATFELRNRVRGELGQDRLPRVFTLHSFALRQLLANIARVNFLQLPLRIADDWEERRIVLEDLKRLSGVASIEHTKDLLKQLSADWQSLTAEDADWEQRFPNPRFLGAWQQHRRVFGYALRDELVYQLKRALELTPDFVIEGAPIHVLVDEYQDLNRCDLAIVRSISERQAEVFCAGDDDQSIYGFRKAHPEGIRRFVDDYAPARALPLEVCKRCDPAILSLALYVARQDPARLEKQLRPEPGRAGGEVVLLQFPDQNAEAAGVAAICNHFIGRQGFLPHEILILLRSDRNGIFSSLIKDALTAVNIETELRAEADPLDTPPGRQALAYLRLLDNAQDSLAWRTLLQERDNGLGAVSLNAIYDLAVTRGVSYARAVELISAEPGLVPRRGGRIAAECRQILARMADFRQLLGRGATGLVDAVRAVARAVSGGPGADPTLLVRFESAIDEIQPEDLGDLVRGLGVADEDVEQEVVGGKVNILSMHRAKGLTARAVIILAVEEEYVPGRAQGDALSDERRLLYVSLTRAKHHLFMTFCVNRRGQQQHSGSTSGNSRRTLTSFLQGGPVPVNQGAQFIQRLGGANP